MSLLDPLAALAPDAVAIASDEALVTAMVRTEAAFLTALGIAAGETGAPAQADRVADVHLDAAVIAADSGASGTPVLPLLAAIRAADDVPLLHRGLTSQDVVDTAFMLVAANVRAHVVARLDDAVQALAFLADEERHTIAAGRTLGQHAAPTTVGLRVAIVADAVLAARTALAATTTPAQLGGSVGTVAVLADRYGADTAAAVRGAFAAELGLPLHAPWHVDRIPVALLAAALATVTTTLGRFGLEVATLAATEVGEVRLEGGGASSAMPQKRNPTEAVLLVAAGRRAPASAAVLLAAPLVAGDRPIGDWHAEWLPLQSLLRDALAASAVAAHLAPRLRIDRERVAANLALTGGAVHTERAQAILAAAAGEAEAARVVRAALAAGGDVLETIASAAPTDVADRIRALAATTGAVGLSDAFVDELLQRVAAVSS